MSIFSNILVSRPKRSVFDLSYENKLSFDMGQLVPIYVEEVVPGDKFRVNSEVFLRFAPMIFPVMHRINCYVHYFFVPYRLIYEDFQEFITGGEDGLSQPVWPRFNLPPAVEQEENQAKVVMPWDSYQGTLADFLGYTRTDTANLNYSIEEFSLHRFRAYQMIYNEYYRDQNLTPPVQFSVAGGNGDTDAELAEVLCQGTDYDNEYDAWIELTKLRYRAWEKDYFTSALPFVQRGVASQIPITLDTSNLRATVASGQTLNTAGSVIDKAFDKSDPSAVLPGDDVYIRTDGTISTNSTTLLKFGTAGNTSGNHVHEIKSSDLSNAVRITENSQGVTITPPTINELRLAEHIQRWLEKNARGGARYVEQILSHFGVRVPDYRLDRPEYLGGGKSPVQISEVLQTSSTDATSPQGSMAGHGYSVGNKNRFKYTFDEHGTVIGILSVLPRTGYFQGVSRQLTKFDKFDFYFPEFAHLGEQAVKYREIYNDQTISGKPDADFGYQERYAEYKYRSDEVHGDFKSTLDAWHMARKFDSEPDLNTSFVQSDPTKRIFAVENGNHMWCQVYNSVRAVRPMPKHAIPSL